MMAVETRFSGDEQSFRRAESLQDDGRAITAAASERPACLQAPSRAKPDIRF